MVFHELKKPDTWINSNSGMYWLPVWDVCTRQLFNTTAQQLINTRIFLYSSCTSWRQQKVNLDVSKEEARCVTAAASASVPSSTEEQPQSSHSDPIIRCQDTRGPFELYIKQHAHKLKHVHVIICVFAVSLPRATFSGRRACLRLLFFFFLNSRSESACVEVDAHLSRRSMSQRDARCSDFHKLLRL